MLDTPIELFDLDIEILEFAIKHGKHDQRSHGRRTARRRAYNAAYSQARAGGATPAESRAKAKEAGLARQSERDERLKRLQERSKQPYTYTPSSEAQAVLKKITADLTPEDTERLKRLNEAYLKNEEQRFRTTVQIGKNTRDVKAGYLNFREGKANEKVLLDRIKDIEKDQLRIDRELLGIRGRRDLVEVDNPTRIDWRSRDVKADPLSADTGLDRWEYVTLNREMNKKIRDTIPEVQRLTSLPLARRIEFAGTVEDRSFAMNRGSGQYIMMSRDGKSKVIVHEIGHALEQNNPAVQQKARSFLEYRTRGEEARSLRELTGQNYDERELAKPDKFTNPYSGKIYNTGDTEIISMGIEYMWTNPRKFAQQDPEYFMFMYDTLRGK